MIRVLVVEDDPVIAEAHARTVTGADGFHLVDVVGGGREALRVCAEEEVDLVLLDLGLPDLAGLEVCRVLRSSATPVDVIAVTSARDREVVRGAVALGIVQYLVKPFTPGALRERLVRYADYHARTTEGGAQLAQHEVDGLFGSLRPAVGEQLPKGLTSATLRRVLDALRDATEGAEASVPGASAAELAERVGASRVTVRRYLEHLCEIGMARRDAVYGTPGRPQQRYVLLADGPR